MNHRRSFFGLAFSLCVAASSLGATAADAPPPAAPASAAPSAALEPCSIRTFYADKRPYESANSDPFYAAGLESFGGALFQAHEAHLVIRTDTGLYEKDEAKFAGKRGGVEFTLPTHEHVVTAWVDGVRAQDGTMVRCIPTGAFYVDGLDGVAMTKFRKRQEAQGRAVIDSDTQVDIGFGIKVRKAGRRPAGAPLPLPATCVDPDRLATLNGGTLHVKANGAATAASVLVDVGPGGNAMDVDVIDSAGNRERDDAMLAAAKAATYEPARWKCVAVPARIRVPAAFEPAS